MVIEALLTVEIVALAELELEKSIDVPNFPDMVDD